MSWWLWPTTADVGIRAFSSSPSLLIDEVIYGMQNIVLSNSHTKHDENTIGEFRKKFLDESVINLEKNLKKISVRLYIFDGDLVEIFTEINMNFKKQMLSLWLTYSLMNTLEVLSLRQRHCTELAPIKPISLNQVI